VFVREEEDNKRGKRKEDAEMADRRAQKSAA